MSSIARKVLVAPISILLIPFTLHKIGTAGYGTWAIVTTIINLAWLLDPGLSPTVTKYVAEHSGTEDIPELRRVLDASCALCLSMAAIAGCILWFGAHVIIREFFRGSGAPAASEILSFWPLVILCIPAFLLTAPFVSFINGRQRMDLTNALIFSAEIVSASATVGFLLAGAGVRGLLFAQLLSSLFTLVGGILITHRLLPGVLPNPFRCRWATLRKLVNFSLPLYSGYVMTTLQGQLEKLYLARLVGVVSVGWYNVANEGAAKIRRVPDLLLGPVLAASSELDALKRQDTMEELYFRTNKYLAFVAVPLMIFAVITSGSLMKTWVGQNFGPVAMPFALLVIGNFFNQMGAPTYFVTVGRGILRPAVYGALLGAGLNLVLSYVFIKQWGFSGAVLGTVVSTTASSLYFLAACAPYFKTPLWRTIGSAYSKPLVCSLTAALAVSLVYLLHLSPLRTLLLGLLAYGVIYMVALFATRFFDRFDFSQAEAHAPFLRFARRIAEIS